MSNNTQYLILTALFTALTAVGAFIKIPFGPVPVTLQILFVVLAGIILGPWYGALSQLLYVGLGLMGLPILANGGGLSYIFNPAFGYLLGFIVAPVIVGFAAQRKNSPGFVRLLMASIIAILVIYIIGVPYMFIIMRTVMHVDITFTKALILGFVVFIPGDVAKSLAAAYLGKKITPIIAKSRLN